MNENKTGEEMHRGLEIMNTKTLTYAEARIPMYYEWMHMCLFCLSFLLPLFLLPRSRCAFF